MYSRTVGRARIGELLRGKPITKIRQRHATNTRYNIRRSSSSKAVAIAELLPGRCLCISLVVRLWVCVGENANAVFQANKPVDDSPQKMSLLEAYSLRHCRSSKSS